MLGNSTNARSIQYVSGSFDDLLSLQSFLCFFEKASGLAQQGHFS